MARILIIGAGGVGRVVAHKCAAMPAIFEDIVLASRTEEKCRKIAAEVGGAVTTATVDADDPRQVAHLMRAVKPELVINVALPYQDLSIMEACLEVGVNYLDTANYEPKDEAKFAYKWQWALHDRFKAKGLTALLGAGFDPGVTNVFTAWARKHYFDEIHALDIVDCNAGDNGRPFATNFNPEINIREVTATGRYWEDGKWHSVAPLSVSQSFDFPDGIGSRKAYLIYHEELESLVRHFPELRSARFWMTFSDSYLEHLRVLQNVGLTSIKPMKYEGMEIVPLKFLKAILPDPAELGAQTKGKTCIGCIVGGVKAGRKSELYVYNICDHQDAYRETGAQAVSYTTGVPAMIGALLMLKGTWREAGVFNMEQFDPDPFMAELMQHGLPWQVKHS